MNFKQYRRKQIAELADWNIDFDMRGVSISEADAKAGSPKPGDKIARNPANHADVWLVAAKYFEDNFETLASLDQHAAPQDREFFYKTADGKLGFKVAESLRASAAPEHAAAEGGEPKPLFLVDGNPVYQAGVVEALAARLAAVTAERDKARKDFDTCSDELEARIEQSEARESELRRDAERLDWLEQQQVTIRNDNLLLVNPMHLRTAIDAALKEKP